MQGSSLHTSQFPIEELSWILLKLLTKLSEIDWSWDMLRLSKVLAPLFTKCVKTDFLGTSGNFLFNVDKFFLELGTFPMANHSSAEIVFCSSSSKTLPELCSMFFRNNLLAEWSLFGLSNFEFLLWNGKFSPWIN